MAAELGWVGLGVAPDFTGFKSKVENESEKAMRAAGVSSGTEFGDAAGKSAGSRFGGVFKKAAIAGMAGVAAAGAAAIKFGVDALDEAREAQKVGALTASTIKSTGGAAKVTAKHVGDLSAKISEQVGIDDEVIQRGANMLLTFKNIRNEHGKNNKMFDRATQAVTDMAAAMAGGKGGEIDLKSASILMGKALNDPVKGLTAMSRVGVQFSDQQKAINTALVEGGNVAALNALGFQVTTADFNKAMEDRKATAEETVRFFTGPMSDSEKKYFDHLAEGGHTLEAQKNILKEVNSQFSGAAAAQATDAEKMKVAWGNFKEEVGTELLPVMDDLANFLTEKGIPKAREFFGWIKDTGVPAVKDLRDDLKPVVGHVKDLAHFINDLPSEVKIGGLASIATLFTGTKLRGGKGGVLGTAGSALGMSRPLPVYVTNPTALGAGGKPGKPGVVATGDGKRPKTPRRLRGGGGNTLAATVAAFGMPWAAEQGQAELDHLLKEYPGLRPLYNDLGLRDPRKKFRAPQERGGAGGLGDLAGFDFDYMSRAARKALEDTAEEFRKAKIPSELKTNIALNGAPESMREARELVRQYELTPPEKKTFFKVIDIEPNTTKAKRWQDLLENTPKNVRTDITLGGVTQAHRQINGLSAALADFASAASSGIDAAGRVVVGAVGGDRGRGRRRNRALGGMP